ncbi:MAG: peptidoglycan-binding protein [Rhodanobacter sp.]|jgi:curli biogenesis system outer membrane secretion channel CsgG|nr:peptidoglycan-binding protein [Rhodanobacter sp.]
MKIRAPGTNPWIGLLVLAGGILATPASYAGSNAQPQIPRCSRTIGTLAVHEPQSGDAWWTSMNLESPAALIKVYVAQSGCFTLVDRGAGLQAAEAERALAAGGEERVGSNIGKGQMKAADYVLIPDIANRNSNAGGNRIGGILGGLLPRGIGAVVGGISLHKKTADVVLTLTDVRSTEQVALEQGHSDKTDIGWAGGGGGGFFGGFAAGGASGYANTEIGQVIAMAYLDAYGKMVADLQRNAPDSRADNVQQAVRLTEATKMYADANLKSSIVRSLKSGMMLYPTGDKVGIWWKVSDELGNVGWVLSNKLELAH